MKENILENLLITKILQASKKMSFYKKVKTNNNFEFDIFHNAVQKIIESKGVLKKDFKVYADYINPLLNKTDPSIFRKNQSYQQHLILNMARTVSISKALESSGKQIFSVNKEFVEFLKQTDFPEEVEISMFKLPYQNFLLHLESFKIHIDIGQLVIDEILVSSLEENNLTLEFVFIEKTIADEEISNIIRVDYGTSFSHIVINIEKNKTLKDLYDHIYNEIKELYHHKQLHDNEKAILLPVIDEVIDVYSQITRVFINLILYLNYIRDDIVDASLIPEKLRKRREYYIQTNNKKKLEKVEKEIARYTKLYLIGRKTKEYIKNQLNSNKGSGKRPHWRRGHIRYYDPAKERKRKFKKQWTYVRPTLVGAKDTSENERIYRIRG